MSGPEPNILIFPLFSFSLWFSFLSRFHTHRPGIVTLIENYTLVSTVSPGKHTLHVCQDSLFARCRLTNRGRQQEKKRHALLFETQSRLQSQFMHCRYIRWQEYRFNSVFIWGNQEVGAPAPYFRLAWDSTSACNFEHTMSILLHFRRWRDTLIFVAAATRARQMLLQSRARVVRHIYCLFLDERPYVAPGSAWDGHGNKRNVVAVE